ncbi:MAG: TonB-dependent receptor plug domain-containing protein, partial [Rhodospirillales bacterium]
MGQYLQNRLFFEVCNTLSSACDRTEPCLERAIKLRCLALAGALVLLASNGSVLAQNNAKTEAVQTAPEVVVTASRLGTGLAGNSTTVISADEIKQSLGRTIPEVLSFEAGVQFRDLYGSTNGAGQTIDVRGFGEPATANTLILINGRRLSDLDLASVDFSSIPLDSIERIEILRGNLGSVLYGGGVQGGTINIVTKSKAAKGIHGNLATGYGSDIFREVKFSGTQGTDDYSLNVFGNYVDSHGYRDNNGLSQKNFTADLRRHGERGDLFVRIDLDNQRLGLPGGRIIDPSTGQNDLTDPRGAQTPNDFALQNGLALALG